MFEALISYRYIIDIVANWWNVFCRMADPFAHREAVTSRHYDQAWLALQREPELRSPNGEIRTVDLFCGCGGLSLGVVEAAVNGRKCDAIVQG